MIEIITVIVIIGILVAVMAISYSGVTNRAKIASLQSDLVNAQSQIELFKLDKSVYPASITDCPSPASTNICVTASSPNTFSGYSVNNSTRPKTYSVTATNGSTSYNVSTDSAPIAGMSSSIVTYQMVLNLDANDTSSYSGSGTAWYDLSGSGNTATMYGAVPFQTDTAKNFNFSGVTGASASVASLGFTFASNMVTRTGDFTISTWIKNPPYLSQTGLFSNAGGGDGYRFGVGAQGIYFLIGPTYTEGNIYSLSTLSSSSWYHVAAIVNRSVLKVNLYLNGVFQNYESLPASQTISTNAAPGLVRASCCSLYTGKLSAFQVYNRALSANEILQNYTATKSTYGL